MRGFSQDADMGNHASHEAMWNACRQLNDEKWEKISGTERMSLIKKFMEENKNLHTDPSVVSANMICTALYGVQRQLKEIKHHLMGVSEDES
jgi:hypothetical protein